MDGTPIVKAVLIRSAVVLPVLVLVSIAIDPGRQHAPLGVASGGVLALLNLIGMRRGLSGILSPNPSAARLIFTASFRLLLLSLAITALALTHKISMLGFLVGFSAVLVLIVAEAFRAARSIDSGD